MARPKKVEADAGGQLMSSADIIWMRDNVITGLSNLEQGVHELRRTYITYFNSRLPEGHPARLNVPFFPSAIYPDGAVARRAETPAATAAAAGGEAAGKRKRKPHDPNAPKRALTSYFLFMQDHKPQIKEANPDWTAAQISAESEKRWENITDDEKAEYEVRYQVDLARYYKQKEAYEAGEPIPEISAGEAQRLYEDQLRSGQPPKGRKVARPPIQNAITPVQGDTKGESTSSDEDEDEDASPEPVKAASPPKTDRASKRQKTAKEEAAKATSAKAAGTTKGKVIPDSPKVDRSSPELDRKKKASKKKDTKADEEDEDAAEVVESSPVKTKSVEKKEKKTRKKRKSEAVIDNE